MVVQLLRAACLAAAIAACGAPGPSQDPSFGSPLPGRSDPDRSGSPSSPGSQAAPPAPTSGTWSRLQVAEGPEPREDHTWTVDSSGRFAYLFGGRAGGTVYDDLWAFDLAAGTWREIQVAGSRPAARFGHEAAWTSRKAGLLVTLGQAGSQFFGDIWQFDPETTTWRELPSAGKAPLPRYGSCSGIGTDGRLWVSHGFTEDGSRFSDTRAYDLEAEAWSSETPPDGTPKERCLHVCWWTADDAFTLYGGQTTGIPALGDLWALVPPAGSGESAWFQLADPAAAARQLPALAQRGGLTYLVGGRDLDRAPLGDAWVVDDRNAGAFTQLPTSGDSPAARSGAAMIHDAERDRMLLFGGIGDAPFDDLWALTFD